MSSILGIFRNHKLKIMALAGFYIFFLYLRFPFNDLGDLVAAKVSEFTNRQIFVSFDTLDLSFIPQPGLGLTNVVVETPVTPTLTARSLSVAPSIKGLLTFKPGVSVYAEGLLGGDVSLSTRGGDKTQAGKRKQKIDVELTDISMAEVSKLAQLPVNIIGDLSATLDSQVELEMTEQPSGNIALTVNKAVIPDSTIPTQFGPVALPKLNLNTVTLEGSADRGTLQISKLVVGKPGGDLYANVVGKMDMKFEKAGPNIQPRIGGYDVTVRMTVGEVFKQKMGMYLGILQTYSNAPNSYAFRISSNNIYNPPNISKVQ